MTKLEAIIDALLKENVKADVWVDGSFLTQKIDPEDSDILLHVEGDFYDNATPEQRRVIDWVKSNLKATHLCDSYVYFEYPSNHPFGALSEWLRAYWIRQFGFSRKVEMKGMALVRLS